MKAHDCMLVPAGISPESRRTAVEEFLAGCRGSARRGIVYLAGLDVGSAAMRWTHEPPDFAAARRDGWGAALDLVHALTASGMAQPPPTLAGHPRRPAAGEIAAWRWRSRRCGVSGGSIAAEHPELGCTRIDLDPRPIVATRPTNWRKKSGRDKAKTRSPTAAASAWWRGCGDWTMSSPAPCKSRGTGPTGWRSPGHGTVAASWTTWPCSRPSANRRDQARSRSGSAPRGSISATC